MLRDELPRPRRTGGDRRPDAHAGQDQGGGRWDWVGLMISK